MTEHADDMIVSNNPQNTKEWEADRCGVVTASEFKSIITPVGKPVTGKSRATYLYLKAAELATGIVLPVKQSLAMEEGHTLEELSCKEYEWINNVGVSRPGLIYLDATKRIGASVDGLVGANGVWENKSPQFKKHVENLVAAGLPLEHKAQVQGQLWITGRDWCDFTSFRPGLRRLQVRVLRDEDYILSLASAVLKFADDVDSLASWIV